MCKRTRLPRQRQLAVPYELRSVVEGIDAARDYLYRAEQALVGFGIEKFDVITASDLAEVREEIFTIYEHLNEVRRNFWDRNLERGER